MKVKDKVFAVTGGGNGMGRELVLGLLERGAKVAAIDINETALKETQSLVPADISTRLSLHIVNITNQTDVFALPEKIIALHGPIDGIINNAGIIQPFVRVNDLAFDTINRVIQVNWFGTLYMTKAFLPWLLKRPAAHIANISSMGGFLPVPGQSIYGASKAAVKLMTEALQSELAGTGVRVSIIFPGAVATNITANSGVKMPRQSDTNTEKSKNRALPPAEAARIILDGIESDQNRIFVGRDSRMMDILYRLSPNVAIRFIGKQMQSLLE